MRLTCELKTAVKETHPRVCLKSILLVILSSKHEFGFSSNFRLAHIKNVLDHPLSSSGRGHQRACSRREHSHQLRGGGHSRPFEAPSWRRRWFNELHILLHTHLYGIVWLKFYVLLRHSIGCMWCLYSGLMGMGCVSQNSSFGFKREMKLHTDHKYS